MLRYRIVRSLASSTGIPADVVWAVGCVVTSLFRASPTGLTPLLDQGPQRVGSGRTHQMHVRTGDAIGQATPNCTASMPPPTSSDVSVTVSPTAGGYFSEPPTPCPQQRLGIWSWRAPPRSVAIVGGEGRASTCGRRRCPMRGRAARLRHRPRWPRVMGRPDRVSSSPPCPAKAPPPVVSSDAAPPRRTPGDCPARC